MNLLRPIIMLAVVVCACVATTRFTPHHSAENSGAFNALYMHLMPAALEAPHHEEAGHEADDHAHGEPLFTLSLPASLAVFDYNQDPSDGVHLVAFNLQIFQLAAVLLILIGFAGVPRHMKDGKGDAVTRFLAGACMYVRDEIVRPNMQRAHAEKLMPLFLCLFFFILFMNLMGLVPGSVTPTACIWVTAALALIVLVMMIIGGMVVQGPVAYWKNLVPHVPLALWPLLFVVEVVGVLVKPFALTIRLFANMTGGHMVVLSFMGLIFYFAGNSFSSMGYATALPAVAFGVFIMIIEAFVAFMQAYVFTILSAIFVGSSLHPEH
ncbi:MAG: F0F1 ATP synthase subunit A [Planctomycetota bacterium]|jgi:F-type H+-transporting ATPase subunit a|nr:F0F1 ATP synthase subunit A [Planctomycetota bacterium]MDP6938212.1 F0F1 ATP synthase subunit A [Planctomycetota bacterium]